MQILERRRRNSQFFSFLHFGFLQLSVMWEPKWFAVLGYSLLLPQALFSAPCLERISAVLPVLSTIVRLNQGNHEETFDVCRERHYIAVSKKVIFKQSQCGRLENAKMPNWLYLKMLETKNGGIQYINKYLKGVINEQRCLRNGVQLINKYFFKHTLYKVNRKQRKYWSACVENWWQGLIWLHKRLKSSHSSFSKIILSGLWIAFILVRLTLKHL